MIDTLQIDKINANDFFSELKNQFENAAKRISPDLLISQKRAALIAEKTPQTIKNWENSGRLKNYAEGNENPKYSLHELITIIDSKNSL